MQEILNPLKSVNPVQALSFSSNAKLDARSSRSESFQKSGQDKTSSKKSSSNESEINKKELKKITKEALNATNGTRTERFYWWC
jgi:hypothetical protein